MARPAAARGRAAATGSRSRVSGREGDEERRRRGPGDEDDEEGRPGQAPPAAAAAATTTGWAGSVAPTSSPRQLPLHRRCGTACEARRYDLWRRDVLAQRRKLRRRPQGHFYKKLQKESIYEFFLRKRLNCKKYGTPRHFIRINDCGLPDCLCAMYGNHHLHLGSLRLLASSNSSVCEIEIER